MGLTKPHAAKLGLELELELELDPGRVLVFDDAMKTSFELPLPGRSHPKSAREKPLPRWASGDRLEE